MKPIKKIKFESAYSEIRVLVDTVNLIIDALNSTEKEEEPPHPKKHCLCAECHVWWNNQALEGIKRTEAISEQLNNPKKAEKEECRPCGWAVGGLSCSLPHTCKEEGSGILCPRCNNIWSPSNHTCKNVGWDGSKEKPRCGPCDHQDQVTEVKKELPDLKWEPKKSETYFFLHDDGAVVQTYWLDDIEDNARKNFLGIFRYRNEAESATVKIKELLKSL